MAPAIGARVEFSRSWSSTAWAAAKPGGMEALMIASAGSHPE